MMDQHFYVAEKLREFEGSSPRPPQLPPGAPKRLLARPVALLGRRMRRLGEGLESWAQPQPCTARSR